MRPHDFGLALATFALGAAPPAYAVTTAPSAKLNKPSRLHDLLKVGEEASGKLAGASTASTGVAVKDVAFDGVDERGYDTAGLVDSQTLSDDPSSPRPTHRRRRIPVATAYAPSLIAAQDTCMGSRGLGVQAMSFGLSIATTWEDVSCRRIHNARALDALGYRGAAIALLCMDDEVHDAMERAGTPCLQSARLELLPPPPPPAPEALPPPIATYSVLFDFDKYRLRPEADQILAPLLAMLQAEPDMAVDIEAHTDWVGTDAYNQRLSERRAQAVVDWLVVHGIARERMRAVGYGESRPIATNQTAAGRQLNRRTEVRRHNQSAGGG